MKHLLLSVVLAFAAPLAAAQASVPAPASAAAGSSLPVSVALQAKSGARVLLIGTLVRRVDGEKFELRDDTGSIVVEIEDRVRRDRDGLLNRKVRITGEVERRRVGGGVHIDADSLTLLD